MPLGIDFFRICCDFWPPKSSHVGSKMYKKLILSCKGRKAEKHYKTRIIFIFLRFQGAKKRAQIYQKTIKKWMQDGDSSWHPFFMDFRRFSEASWSQVGIKNGLNIDAKRYKKKSKQEASWRRLGRILEVQEVWRGRVRPDEALEGGNTARGCQVP